MTFHIDNRKGLQPPSLRKICLRKMLRRTRVKTPMFLPATVAQKSFDGNFTSKIGFQIGRFILPLLMHRIVPNIQN